MGMARGSVNHPLLALWLSGWRGAGRGRMHPGTGSLHSPLCSPSLLLPAYASPAETHPASVTAVPARGPLPATTTSSLPLLSQLHYLFSLLSFHSCCSTSSMRNNGGNIRQSHGRQFICVQCSQRQRSASENLTTRFLLYLC